MINYIKGKIVKFGEDYIVLESNNIGYLIYTSSHSMGEFNQTQECVVHTQMLVREDDISLCGFSSPQELEVFNLLKSVSRIGTKVSLAMLSSINYIELIHIIKTGEINSLTTAPGVGKKTAQRIVFELKDKISNQLSMLTDEIASTIQVVDHKKSKTEATQALVSLGYSQREAKTAIKEVCDYEDVEDLIKKSLQLLMID